MISCVESLLAGCAQDATGNVDCSGSRKRNRNRLSGCGEAVIDECGKVACEGGGVGDGGLSGGQAQLRDRVGKYHTLATYDVIQPQQGADRVPVVFV